MNACTIHQTLSHPDSLTEHAFEGTDEIALASFIAQPPAAAFTGSNGQATQRWAVVTTARQEETTVNSTRYVLEMRSWFHLLRDAPACAVYQNMTVPEIVKKAAKAQGFVDIKESLAKTHAKREYTVQYNESTFDFLSRIMAEDGIFYYFEHSEQKHTLVLADSQSGLFKLPDMTWRAANAPETPDGCVWNLRPERRAAPAAAKVDDHNFLTPSTSLAATAGSGTPQYHTDGTRHTAQKDGETVAARRLASLQSAKTVLHGKTAAPEMAVGGIFNIKNCPVKSLNAAWAVVAFDMTIDENGNVDASFTAVPPAAVAPPLPARPRVAGPMTGVVCGKSGDEILTDEHGRIKVRFHWDRQGKADDTASCWLRVAQPWAGAGYGAMFLPRVGQEVLVDFLGGDPDRPVVVGCLYNAANKPPWKLPDNAAVTGVKGKSSPKGGIGNEISLDDKKDKERIFLHAQKLLELLAEDERKVRIAGEGGDKLVLDKGSRTEEITKGDDTLTLGEGSRTVELKKGGDTLILDEGSRDVSIKKGDDTLTVKGKRVIKIDGDCEIDIGGTLTIKAGGNILLQSGKGSVSIESKTGLSLAAGTDLSAKAKTGLALEAGTALSGKAKTGAAIDGGVQLDLKGAAFTLKGSGMGTVDGGGMLVVKGGMVKIN